MAASAWRRWWRSPWAWSAAVHAVALAGLAWWHAGARPPAPALGVGGAGGGAGGTPPRPIAATPVQAAAAEADARIASSVATARKLPPAQQFSQALRYAEQLERISSAASMADIGKSLAKSMGFAARQYAPVVPPPPGAFDTRTQLPYRILTEPQADGAPRRWLVWVDKDGRTMRDELTPNHPLTKSPLALQALERLDASPTLRGFRDEVLLKVFDTLLDDGRK